MVRKSSASKKRARPAKQHIEVVARTRPLNSKELAEGDAQYCIAAGNPKGDLDTVQLTVTVDAGGRAILRCQF
jgi:hypothetical protein